MKACLLVLKPQLVVEEVEPAGKIVIGTVYGDLHDIGADGYAPDASKAVSLAKELVRSEDVASRGTA